MTILARIYVWNTEGVYFSLDEALGFVRPSSTIFNSFFLLVYDFIRLKNINWD